MKVVALISGGKDSCFNIMHCVANGHSIIALANLFPPRLDVDGKDEIDSFMYQTVGHDAIHLYAECMALPLYRREIQGGSRVRSADYIITQDDETEDLFELLKEIKANHPDIQAVSVGAILSNYQRVRVEHVCNRLGLTPLAYLWRRDQRELLSEMADAGIEAVLIKVAAIGLKQQHLGKSIKQMFPHLCDMHKKYHLHICGEGGEYETFTIDCPLFVKRIVIEEMETVLHSNDAFAPVAYLRLKRCSVVDKPAGKASDSDIRALVRMPEWKEGWEATYDQVLRSMELAHSRDGSEHITIPKVRNDMMSSFNPEQYLDNYQICAKSPFYAISGTTAYDRHAPIPNRAPYKDIQEETTACMTAVQDRLNSMNLVWTDVVMMQVLVSDIADFARVNEVYKTFFDINPPPRALIGANLPEPALIQIDCLAIKPIIGAHSSNGGATHASRNSGLQIEANKKDTMHVQGISYWAPANIGPYSQSVTTHSHAYIAGQIGLIPALLTLPSPVSIKAEVLLSLRHLHSITSVLSLKLRQQTALCLCFIVDERSIPSVKSAWEVVIGEKGKLPPTLYITVPALPKGAQVEWQVVLHTLPKTCSQRRRDAEDDDDDDDDIDDKWRIRADAEDTHPTVWSETSYADDDTLMTITRAWFMHPMLTVVSVVHVIDTIDGPLNLSTVINQLIDGVSSAVEGFETGWDTVFAMKMFYPEALEISSESWERAMKTLLRGSAPRATPAITFVPVRTIGDGGLVALCIQGAK